MARPRIAVFSGASSTIANSEPLVTSNKARGKYGLPPLLSSDGTPPRFDALRPQRLAAPVTVYVEQFSAHPLEADAADLYAPPDGYVDATGAFHRERQNPEDVPVYEVELRPEDGVYPLPYMARQKDGRAWEGDATDLGAPPEKSRQPFYPNGARLFEEIDRLGVSDGGRANVLSDIAEFDFYRAAPPGGYTRGLPAAERTDQGEGDIAPEVLGRDFFPYRPAQLRQEPGPAFLARITNMVQDALASGSYSGAIWMEGSPFVEETGYWLNLLVDTTLPICGNAAQRPHGAVSSDGDRNIFDSVTYITSRVWADASGADEIGVVVVQDQRIFTAREVQKGDARPGGYVTTGGHGGIVGGFQESLGPVLLFRPMRRHTSASALKLSSLPETIGGLRGQVVAVKEKGHLLASAIPAVAVIKHARYSSLGVEEVEAHIAENLAHHPLSGFVGEGAAPYGSMPPHLDQALGRAIYSGMPVVKVGRGNAEGFTPKRGDGSFIAGSNLTATKARLLLMAGLLKLGALPAAADPAHPTEAERQAVREHVARYQELFDTH